MIHIRYHNTFKVRWVKKGNMNKSKSNTRLDLVELQAIAWKRIFGQVKRCRTLLEQTRKRVRHTKKIIERAWLCTWSNFPLFRQQKALHVTSLAKFPHSNAFVFSPIIHELHPPILSTAPHPPKRVLLWRNPSARGFKQAKLTKTIAGIINENEASTFGS